MDKVLVDTDILSDFLRGKNAAVQERARVYLADRGRLTLSVVTIFEIVRGRHHAGQLDHASAFLTWTRKAEVLPFDAGCAVRAGEIAGSLYQVGRPLAVADVLIGATALVHGLVVATANVKHYERLVPFGLRLENWRDG
jgi:predicted nucleic acid-binding protein